MAFLIRATSKGFRVLEESYNPRKVKTVPVSAYAALGFRSDMPLSEAKARAAQINQQAELESKRMANTVRRVELLKTEASAYLPSTDVTRFETELSDMYADNPYRHDVTLRYWRACQLCILELAIDPKDFRASNHRLINYFKSKKWSHDYIKRITRILNLWGTSVCRARGSLFEPIPNLTSVQVQRIADAREDAGGMRVAALPLPWLDLKNARDKFEQDGLLHQWNWMFISTWFGLRPSEVDALHNQKMFRISRSAEHRIDVLEVYQSKLISIRREQRWKVIPVFLKEQKEALTIIKSGQFKRPLNKTLRRIFWDGIETYSPRKAFVDLMLGHGFGLEDISTFLGHQDIGVTWRVYKNKRKFSLPKSAS